MGGVSRWQALDGRTLSTGHTLRVVGTYDNGRYAVDVFTPDGFEVECRLTVNLVEHLLEENEFHVRFESRNYAGEVFDALIAEGIAEPTGRVVGSGFVERYAEVWRLADGEA